MSLANLPNPAEALEFPDVSAVPPGYYSYRH